MYPAAAALWEQITAFPERVLQTEMAPRRLISTQNEELMHQRKHKPPSSTSSPDSSFWNHTQGHGLKPNLSALDLFCWITPYWITSFQFMANQVSHQNLPCSYIPNLALPKSPLACPTRTASGVRQSGDPLCEGGKAELPPKVTCAALGEMSYKPVLEEHQCC